MRASRDGVHDGRVLAQALDALAALQVPDGAGLISGGREETAEGRVRRRLCGRNERKKRMKKRSDEEGGVLGVLAPLDLEDLVLVAAQHAVVLALAKHLPQDCRGVRWEEEENERVYQRGMSVWEGDEGRERRRKRRRESKERGEEEA